MLAKVLFIVKHVLGQWLKSILILQWFPNLSEPLRGPDVSVNPVGDKHILIEWKELDQEKQRGFITHYTVYFQRQKDKMLLQNSE